MALVSSERSYHRVVILAEEIESAHLGAGHVAIWWLGQAGFVIRSADATVVIDPCLSSNSAHPRNYPAPISAASFGFVNVLLGTHYHDDHIDPVAFPAILEASPAAAGVVPAPMLPDVAGFGISEQRLIPAIVDEALHFEGVSIIPRPAWHADHTDRGYGFHLDAQGRHPYLGYLIKMAGISIYHTGDTLCYQGLGERLRGDRLDILMLPINGMSADRERVGIVGNMDIAEAAALADECQPRLTVPMHYDLFDDNGADVEEFVRHTARHHPGLQPLVLSRGIRYDVVA